MQHVPDIGGYLYIVPILAVLILVHELGHFFAARMCGVKVEEFGIGIPPRLFGRVWKGVLWSVNAIPFGGFVRVKGEDGSNMEPDSMNAQPPHERAFFLTAGVAMNVLFAVALMILVIGIHGVAHSNSYVADVVGGSPAAKAGWKPGDRIVAINGNTVEDTEEIANTTRSNAGDEIMVTIERRGKLYDTAVTPRMNPPEGQGAVGIMIDSRTEGEVFARVIEPGSAAAEAVIQPGDRIAEINDRTVRDTFVLSSELNRFIGFDVPIVIARGGQLIETELAVPRPETGQDSITATGITTVRLEPIYEKVPALKVVPRGFEEAFDTTRQMINGIKTLFSSTENLGQVAGPVGMAQLTNELVELDSPLPVWVRLAQLAILLSINLAILNLLPLPALDGGRLMFVLLEIIRGGRKIAPEKEGLVHFAGLVLILGLMFVIAFNDINRLFDGNSFIP
jgi:regulator of sigma E protease